MKTQILFTFSPPAANDLGTISSNTQTENQYRINTLKISNSSKAISPESEKYSTYELDFLKKKKKFFGYT